MSVADVPVALAVVLLALLFAGALAPLEALGWWAGWFGAPADREALPKPSADDTDPRPFLVFLSGIHSVSGETFARRELRFLQQLRGELPHVGVIEVFPYSVTDRPLTGERVFARFWRWALAMKLSGRWLSGAAGMLINVRNVWQVAVSADRRYGPIYNRGSAQLIADALRRNGYKAGSPVVLVGYSGGGQVALGAAPHLQDLTGGEVTVVSLGGVVSADPGIPELRRVYHLSGERDAIARLGAIVFPGRWTVLGYSTWNAGRRRGIVRVVDMGPLDHTGAGGYLDADRSLPDGRTYLQSSVDAVAAIVRGEDPAPAA